MTWFNVEHPLNKFVGIFWISPVNLIAFISSKIPMPNDVTDDGIEISVSDEHPEKADDSIDVTDVGIAICFSFEHPLNKLVGIIWIFPVNLIDSILLKITI